jgi:chromosome segregation protein
MRSQKDIYETKQKKIVEKRMEAARYEAICDTAKDEAREKFGPGFLDKFEADALPVEFEGSQSEYKNIEKVIKELHQKITDMGPVNERALEEFKDVMERYNFLVSQKEDIERSLVDLNNSILKMEEVTVEKFKEIYEKVNKEFQVIFPILFPGGSAELHLLDEQNWLTTGVEILVRLPGKRLQNMSLFSGGEKALTAISLIFSLLKTTPAPFCFLDEVDAPLDEANVGRFNGVLEALSNEFQFIVITHNRRTMEVLDTIYGISMTEPGVSQLVSVDLSQVPEHLRKKQKAAI